MEEVSVCLFPHAPPDTHTHVLLCPGRLLKVGGVSCSFPSSITFSALFPLPRGMSLLGFVVQPP